MTLYDRAAIIPGRSCTRSKSPDRLIPVWAEDYRYTALLRGHDGIERVDMLAALGARSLGYERIPPPAWGVSSLPHRFEVDAAEAILQHVAPWASSVRFFKTGSEATQAAYLIARRATGGGVFYRGDWSYHGWHDWIDDCYLLQQGSEITDTTHLAGVIIEPHRWEPVNVEWLRYLRDVCDKAGALLIFDGMIYGGRWALGGASEYFGVKPDLECFGKAFGNGQAVAFVVGNEALKEHGELASGTYSGDATGLGVLLETLRVYTTEPVIETLWERGKQLQDGLKAVIPAELGVVEGMPVHQRIRFHEKAEAPAGAYNYSTDRPMCKFFREHMAAQGFLILPDAINPMFALTKEQVAQAIEAAFFSARETLRAHV